MFKEIGRFFLERQKWIKAGKPYRSEEKIKELFKICSSNECQNYIKKNDKEGSCNICGCRLVARKEYLNKLAWATTECPLEPPKWGLETGFESLVLTDDEVKEAAKEEDKENEEFSSKGATIAAEQSAKEQSGKTAPAKKKGGCGCGKKK